LAATDRHSLGIYTVILPSFAVEMTVPRRAMLGAAHHFVHFPVADFEVPDQAALAALVLDRARPAPVMQFTWSLTADPDTS
jgi:hypothetical protein